MATSLTSQAKQFVDALDDLGFGPNDESVDGADTVDVICEHEDLLRRLPALCELADEVDRFFTADGNYRGSLIAALRAAHDKLKGA